MTKIIGAGGGGGGGKGGQKKARTPKESKDNLDSVSYVKVVDLLSEGEIYGLKNGYQSIFFDNTPLQNPDGSFNFSVQAIDFKNGTQDQSSIPGFEDVSNEVNVGVGITYGAPVTRTITDSTVNAVRVTITVPQLQELQKDGDVVGATANVYIYVQYNGGGYSLVVADQIRGRTIDSYQRDYLIGLGGAFPVDIRVLRPDVDSTSARLINAWNWTSYTEITWAALRYPNSALIAFRISAEQFSNIPQRSYLIRGIKVSIPNNATVDSTTGRLIHSGVWSGTFGAAQWTTDPAWILWDLLTSTRYGFGDHINAAQLDKFSFYSASQYCSELVPNGFGGYEPRFSCNVNIQTQEDAYKLINDMCSTFRAMPYWSNGALTISQDKPESTSYLFTLANVDEEGFSYAGSDQSTRPTVAIVSYMDLSIRDIAREVVEDTAAIAKFGVNTVEISAFACTSRGQANRIGDWLLYSNQYETEVVTFTTSIDAGVLVRPGQIIEISDPVRAGTRRGGRIRTATTTAITVDDATGLIASNAPSLAVIMPDGTVETRNVSSIVGNVVTVSSAFSSAPNFNSVWIFQTSDIQTSTWRVLGIQEQDQCRYSITALSYNSSKYGYVERGQALQTRDITNLNEIPASPTNFNAQELFYELNGRAATKIVVSWQSVKGITNYQLRWRVDNGNWSTINLDRVDYEILDTKAGVYEIQVAAISSSLISSEYSLLNFSAAGDTALPANVTGVSLVPIDAASAILSWEASTELDVRLGGKVLIRHSPRLDTPQWGEALEIVPSASGNQTQKQVPLLEGSYLLRFQDAGGRQSAAVTYVIADLPTPQPRQLVQTYAEDQESPPFNGNTIDMFYTPTFDALVLSTGALVDTFATDSNWDGVTTIDAPGGVLTGEVVSQGEYEFGSTWDMGGVFDVNLQRRFITRTLLQTDIFDSKTADIDTWDYLDGVADGKVNAALYVRSTPADPAAAPTWSEWREFSNAIVRGRAFQFKTIATSTDTAQNILIDELGVTMELQQRIEQSATLTTAASLYTATFGTKFYQAPSIGITAYNMATGDFWTIDPLSITRSGFQITFKNSSGAAISRQFTYTAIGYGSEIV